MVAWMETAMADEPEDSLVIFQLLDSSMYHTRTDEGGLAPAKRGSDSIYCTMLREILHWPLKNSSTAYSR